MILLAASSQYVDLTTVQPVLELFMGRLCIVLAGQVKMQKNIVNLVEQWLVRLVTLASLCFQVSWNCLPPVVEFPNHNSGFTFAT